MDLHVGIPFELYPMGEGKLVIYDSHALEKAESSEGARQFVQSLLGLAAIKNPCTTSDARLQVVGLERRGGGRGIFVLNPSSRPVEGDLLFPNEVCVGDLGSQLSRNDLFAGDSSTMDAPAGSVASQRFRLECPPCGVLPMEVMDSQWEDELERRQAARVMEETQRSALVAAESELTGWSENMSSEGLSWN